MIMSYCNLQSAIDWFKNNSIIANPDKLQTLILSKSATDVTHKSRVYDNEIETTKSVKLLGMKIDYQIKFNEHISLRYVLKRRCN